MTQQTNTTPQADPGAPRRSVLQRLTAIRPGDLVVLVVLCVVVGMVLAFLNVDPATLWVDFFGAVAEAWSEFFENIWAAAGWALQYFFLGAVIIVPIWLIFHVIRAFSNK